MSLLVKVQSGTPFVPAGMPSHATRESCQVRPCPLEIEAESVGDPYLLERTWQVNIFPVKEQGLCGPHGYYSRVAADRIMVDDRRLHIVKVAEVHLTPVPIFAADGQDAIAQVQGGIRLGYHESQYDHTCETDQWCVEREGKDVTDEFAPISA